MSSSPGHHEQLYYCSHLYLVAVMAVPTSKESQVGLLRDQQMVVLILARSSQYRSQKE